MDSSAAETSRVAHRRNSNQGRTRAVDVDTDTTFRIVERSPDLVQNHRLVLRRGIHGYVRVQALNKQHNVRQK